MENTNSRVTIHMVASLDGFIARKGRLQLLNDADATPVTESDMRLRFNNWDRIRAQRIPSLLSAGIGLGASGVFFLFGVLGWGPAKAEALKRH
ncbi:MAG: hypothetical protein ACM36C_11315 [Acidobacteriota bacterium]